MNIVEYRDYCLAKPGVIEQTPFGPETLVFKVGGKIFALLDNDPGELVRVTFEEAGTGRSALLVVGQGDNVMLGQKAIKHPVHADLGIADGHRSGGIAVIGPGEGQKLLSRAHALVQPKLHRHFHCDFDGDRAGIREEDVVKIAWHARREPPSQR